MQDGSLVCLLERHTKADVREHLHDALHVITTQTAVLE
jgi:hypothetical protein